MDMKEELKWRMETTTLSAFNVWIRNRPGHEVAEWNKIWIIITLFTFSATNSRIELEVNTRTQILILNLCAPSNEYEMLWKVRIISQEVQGAGIWKKRKLFSSIALDCVSHEMFDYGLTMIQFQIASHAMELKRSFHLWQQVHKFIGPIPVNCKYSIFTQHCHAVHTICENILWEIQHFLWRNEMIDSVEFKTWTALSVILTSYHKEFMELLFVYCKLNARPLRFFASCFVILLWNSYSKCWSIVSHENFTKESDKVVYLSSSYFDSFHTWSKFFDSIECIPKKERKKERDPKSK